MILNKREILNSLYEGFNNRYPGNIDRMSMMAIGDTG